MLQYGFFNPVHMDAKENVYEKVRDAVLAKEMVDSQEAYYDFVSESSISEMCVLNTLSTRHPRTLVLVPY